MIYHVYMLLSKSIKPVTYVGYTKDLKNRIKLHNSGKGAKFTRGRDWKMIYKKAYNSKSEAMKAEYKLKKNSLLRKKIKDNYIKNIS